MSTIQPKIEPTPGIYYLMICPNRHCGPNFSKWVQVGYGTFEFNYENHHYRCSRCTNIQPVRGNLDTVGFYHCTFRMQGEIPIGYGKY